jgi:uncharacterized protein YndB with AHSA1/START domain
MRTKPSCFASLIYNRTVVDELAARRRGPNDEWNWLSITSVDTDYDRLTVTLVSDFDASVEQVWELWSDPRKLERWWGPPAYPATFEKHDLIQGGEVTYFMIGPEGDRWGGMWRVTAVDPPTSLEFTDAFADTDGTPITDMPVYQVSVRLSEHESGTRMEMRSKFESRGDLERWLGTGTLEGQQQAVAQMDALLGS